MPIWKGGKQMPEEPEPQKWPLPSEGALTAPVEIVSPDMTGFTADELFSLDLMRSWYSTGAFTEQKEVVEEQHRLDFVRWLVEQGRLTEFPEA